MSLDSKAKAIKSPERVRILERPNGVYEGTVDILASGGVAAQTVRFEVIPHDSRIHIRPERPMTPSESELIHTEITDLGKIYGFDTTNFEETTHIAAPAPATA